MEIKRNYNVALFDLDGVVVNTEPRYSEFWANIGKEYLPDVERFEDIIKGCVLSVIMERFFPEDKALQDEIVGKLEVFERDMPYDDIPGVVPFIRSLRERGVRTAVVTSSNRQKMHSFFSARPDLLPLFDHVFTGEDYKASKPDPYCYLLGAEYFGARKDECVIFEDSINGLKAARASGMFTVGLTTTFPAEDVSPLADVVIDNFLGFTL